MRGSRCSRTGCSSRPLACAVVVAVGAGSGRRRPTGTRRLALRCSSSSALSALWWGGVRLEALERSVLVSRIGERADALVAVTGPAAPRSLLAVRRPGRGAAVRRRAHPGAGAARAAGRARASAGCAARAAGAPGRPARARDRLRRARLARAARRPRRAARERRLADRRPAGRDRWRRRPAARGIVGSRARPRTHGGERRRLLDGVVLGDDEGTRSGDLQADFQASGLYHLLAVSGQNIAFIGVRCARARLRRSGVPARRATRLAIAAILAYALAVGWQPSVVRAAVAGCLASLAWLVVATAATAGTRWRSGRSCSSRGRRDRCSSPAFSSRSRRWPRSSSAVPRLPAARAEALPRSSCPGCSAASSASRSRAALVDGPILWLHFGAIPLWTVPRTRSPSRRCRPLLGSRARRRGRRSRAAVRGGRACVARRLGRSVDRVLGAARRLASRTAQTSSRTVVLALLIGSAPSSLRSPGCPDGRRRRSSTVLAPAVPSPRRLVGGLAPPPSWSPPTGLRVSFLDVGQGDAEPPRDAGGRGARRRRATARRTSTGSFGGWACARSRPSSSRMRIATTSEVRRGRLQRLAGGCGDRSDAAGRRPRRARPRRSRARARRRPARRRSSRAGVPPRQASRPGPLAGHAGLAGENPHLHGVVLLASYGAIDVLLTGDSESEVTRSLPLRPVEVLKVAHHGSADPGLADELRVLRPRVAVISVGAHNDYGHPRPETLAALLGQPGLDALPHRRERPHRARDRTAGALTVRTERGVRLRPCERAARELKPVYLISGSDRAQGRARAPAPAWPFRTRGRSSVVSALELAGPGRRGALQLGQPVRRRAARPRRRTSTARRNVRGPADGWLEGGRRRGGRRLPRGAGAGDDRARARRLRRCKKDAAAREGVREGGRRPRCSTSPSEGAWPGSPSASGRPASRPRPMRARCSSSSSARIFAGLANEIDKLATWARRRAGGVSARSSSSSRRWPRRRPSRPHRRLGRARHRRRRSRRVRADLRPLRRPRRDTRAAARPQRWVVTSRRLRRLKRLRERACRSADAAAELKTRLRSTARSSTARPRRSPTTSSRAAIVGSPSSTSRSRAAARLAPDLELQRALIDVSARAASRRDSRGVRRAAAGDEARGLRLLARRPCSCGSRRERRPCRSSARARRCSAAIASASPSATAVSSRFVERLDRRAVAEVLVPLPGGDQDALLLLLMFGIVPRSPVLVAETRNLGSRNEARGSRAADRSRAMRPNPAPAEGYAVFRQPFPADCRATRSDGASSTTPSPTIDPRRWGAELRRTCTG